MWWIIFCNNLDIPDMDKPVQLTMIKNRGSSNLEWGPTRARVKIANVHHVHSEVRTDAGKMLHRKVLAIADHLPGWEYVTTGHACEWWSYLQDLRGRKVHIGADCCLEENWSRWNISGTWPRGVDGTNFYPNEHRDPKAPRITCSMTRTAEAVAKDIQRRFLPAFVPLWDQMEDRRAIWDKRHTDRDDMMRTLAEVAHGEYRPAIHQSSKPTVTTQYAIKDRTASFLAEAWYDDRIKMTIDNLTQEQAEFIATYLLKCRGG